MLENKIKICREKLNMSQEELAEKSTVSRATISGLESGRVTVTTTGTLQKIAEALGKPVSEIFFT
jgi:transcriptional regulator with XRE-family HTH domain